MNLLEYFKDGFKELLNMAIPEWIISPFDGLMESSNLDTFLKKKESIEMIFSCQVTSMFTFK